MTESLTPLLNNHFTVHVDSQNNKDSRYDIAFDRITGIQSTRAATGLGRLTSYFNKNIRQLVLRRAIDKDHFFFEWHRTNLRKIVDLRTLTVVQLDANHRKPMNIWQYYDSWIETWHGPDFDANNTAIAYETITLGYRSVRWLESK